MAEVVPETCGRRSGCSEIPILPHVDPTEGHPLPDEDVPLVLWPGYGMGAGSYALTFRDFHERFPRVHAVDWLGFGKCKC